MSDLDNTDWADGLPSTDGMEDMNTAELETFDDPSKSKAPLSREERKKLDAILDIPVTITMEVGHAKISIRNLLQLNQGSVIELERLAGEPLDVLVNGTLIAHGEVVVVNDKFGIRLTDVISQVERIKKLQQSLVCFSAKPIAQIYCHWAFCLIGLQLLHFCALQYLKAVVLRYIVLAMLNISKHCLTSIAFNLFDPERWCPCVQHIRIHLPSEAF